MLGAPWHRERDWRQEEGVVLDKLQVRGERGLEPTWKLRQGRGEASLHAEDSCAPGSLPPASQGLCLSPGFRPPSMGPCSKASKPVDSQESCFLLYRQASQGWPFPPLFQCHPIPAWGPCPGPVYKLLLPMLQSCSLWVCIAGVKSTAQLCGSCLLWERSISSALEANHSLQSLCVLNSALYVGSVSLALAGNLSATCPMSFCSKPAQC